MRGAILRLIRSRDDSWSCGADVADRSGALCDIWLCALRSCMGLISTGLAVWLIDIHIHLEMMPIISCSKFWKKLFAGSGAVDVSIVMFVLLGQENLTSHQREPLEIRQQGSPVLLKEMGAKQGLSQEALLGRIPRQLPKPGQPTQHLNHAVRIPNVPPGFEIRR